jgi:hypothetical protein
MRRLPSPTRQTEELQVDKYETSEMRAIRIEKDRGEFLRRYLIEQRLYYWLYAQIQDSYQDHEQFIATSKTYGFQQHCWLYEQLKGRNAMGLIETFEQRCNVEGVTPWQATFTREIPKEGVRSGRAK